MKDNSQPEQRQTKRTEQRQRQTKRTELLLNRRILDNPYKND
jgi:hypothetical protein